MVPVRRFEEALFNKHHEHMLKFLLRSSLVCGDLGEATDAEMSLALRHELVMCLKAAS
jgi:hypothetical protein